MLTSMLVALAPQAATAAACRPALASLQLTAPTPYAGTTLTGTVRLRCVPARATKVVLTGTGGAQAPRTVTVPRGQRVRTFSVRTSTSDSARRASVAARLDGRTVRDVVRLRPTPNCSQALESVSVPTLLHAGDRLTGEVRMRCIALNPTRVTVRSDQAHLVVGPTVVVPAGKRSVSFPVTAALADGPTYGAQVTASFGGASGRQAVTVQPGLKDISISQLLGYPNDFFLVYHFTGDVPVGGLTLRVASNRSAVTVPATHHVEQVGALGGQVDGVQVHPVTADTPVTLSVSLGTRTLRVTKTLLAPWDDDGLTVQRYDGPVLFGGQQVVQVDVLLDHPAPADGLTVNLTMEGDTEDDAAAAGLDTLTAWVLPGGTMASFFVTAAPVTQSRHPVIVATAGGVTSRLTLTVHPIATAIEVPATVVGGQPLTATLRLAGPADDDIAFWVQPGADGVDTPGIVILPAGQTLVTFDVATSVVDEPFDNYLSATFGGLSLSSDRFTVTP